MKSLYSVLLILCLIVCPQLSAQDISPVWIIDNHQFEFEEEIALIDVFTPSPNRTCGILH